MCTLVILRRPGGPWPLILAANRDEMADRPWSSPARHWPDRSEVVAGRDDQADGTWMGVNDFGVVAAVLNRRNALGPQPGKRSRGELPLEALDHETAVEAAKDLTHLDLEAYRPFNLFIGDSRNAYLLCARSGGNGNPGAATIETLSIPEGVSMVTAAGLDEEKVSARTRLHLPRFREAPEPDPETGDWDVWRALLGSREHGPDSGPEGAMNIETGGAFGTVCASLLALPATTDPDRPPIWLFAAGRPDTSPFEPVRL